MFQGFKNFLMRGNVVELAVAVVIGTAFTAIVTAFTKGIIQPLINTIGGSDPAKGFGFQVLADKESTFIDLGSVINAAIDFVIVAAVVYFILVLPMQKLAERRKAGEEAGPSEPTDVELLTEIRDLLAAQKSGK